MEILARNVNEAFPIAWGMLHKDGVHRPSRNGPMIEYPGVVSTTYRYPQERVLFHKTRDANPFFHLFESMWMLAERNDVAWLSTFNRQMLEYSDDGVTLTGSAYGARWKETLPRIQGMLMHTPDTRRAYMPLFRDADVWRESKDITCNVGIDFKLRDGDLNMTVFNRSNDMIWGAYGANVVHFSMLQEWLANRIGAMVGTYTQVSTSFHVYPEFEVYKKIRHEPAPDDPYDRGETEHWIEPLMADPAAWKQELADWMEEPSRLRSGYRNTWFPCVMVPMHRAWSAWKRKDTMDSVLDELSNVEAPDWKSAATFWVKRRMMPATPAPEPPKPRKGARR